MRLVSTKTAVAGMADTDGNDTCVGFVVSGAGSTDANGCYARKGSHVSQAHYVLGTTGYSLYNWKGFWHLGVQGKTVLYRSVHTSSAPPGESTKISLTDGTDVSVIAV